MRTSDWSSDVCSSDLNAATSSVAGWVRRLAAGRGIHILNVVRAAQRGDGPDIFLTDGDDLADRVIAIAGRQPKGALDAVAGTATGRLARCLAANGPDRKSTRLNSSH